MNEIRFRQPLKEELKPQNREEVMEQNPQKPSPNAPRKNFFKAFFWMLAFICVFSAAFFARDTFLSLFGDKSPDAYSAVFLLNNQVYFGKMVENKRDTIILKEVFYIQVNENMGTDGIGDISSGRFNLVKLGDEIHGPTDELYINKDNVVFYEYLRDDSTVAQAIKEYGR